MKKNMKKLDSFLLSLAVLTAFCACQKEYELLVSISDVNLTASEGSSAVVGISGLYGSDAAEWTIEGDYDANLYFMLSSSHGTGTADITITASTANDNPGERTGSFVVTCGTESATITVRQRSSVDAECVAVPVNVLGMTYGVACNVNVGSRCGKYYMGLYEAQTAGTMTDNDFRVDLQKTSSRRALSPDYPENNPEGRFGTDYKEVIAWFSNLKSNTNYVLVTAAYTSDGEKGCVTQQPVTTKNDKYQPTADITDIAHDGDHSWTVNMKGNCSNYYTYACVANQPFDSYTRDDHGIVLAWRMMQSLPLVSKDNSMATSFNTNGGKMDTREYIYPKQRNNNTFADLSVKSTDRYLHIVVWGFSADDADAYSGMLSEAKIELQGGNEETVYVTSITLHPTSLYLEEEETATLTATVIPSNAVNKELTWTSSDKSVASVNSNGVVTAVSAGTATITCAATDGSGVKATCNVTVTKPGGTADGVDLGLPSGILWATCNVGAESPENYGDYFSWGETTGYKSGKTTFSLSYYTYYDESDGTLTKYCIDNSMGYCDGRILLEAIDDAATVNCGGAWRTPTYAEWNELNNTDNCTWTWVIQNKVYGYKVTSVKNGNFIFLPASGYWDGNTNSGKSSCAFYWSSVIYDLESDCAQGTYIDEEKHSEDYYGSRFLGASIRPVLGTPRVLASSIQLSSSSLTITEGTTAELTATISPSSATFNDLCWFSSNSSVAKINRGTVTAVAAGTATLTVVAADGSGAKAACKVTVTKGSISHEAVDLGLPSGIKWATCNIGANNPEDYGDYFAWGETKGYNSGKTTFTWENYTYCKGTEDTMTKYCSDSSYGYNGYTDSRTTLTSADDAATANWGDDWRMPTYDEWSELTNTDNCTWTWTTENSINGYKVTSKKNKKSIFLPAAGARSSTQELLGEEGFYWSSSLYTNQPNRGHETYFTSEKASANYVIPREFGLSVRPVTD